MSVLPVSLHRNPSALNRLDLQTYGGFHEARYRRLTARRRVHRACPRPGNVFLLCFRQQPTLSRLVIIGQRQLQRRCRLLRHHPARAGREFRGRHLSLDPAGRYHLTPLARAACNADGRIGVLSARRTT